MAKSTGFLDQPRAEARKRPVAERVRDHREVELPTEATRLELQAARCMDCGVPCCHAYGCPLCNRVPDINDLVYHRHWRRALDLLHATNNFPEITGRICPALCEAACTLAQYQEAVTVRQIERELVERGWREGWITPRPSETKTGKRVAIIGAGPAGLAAAQQLVRRGHRVIIFEKADKPGGILRYGIPDFKLEKRIIDRRLEQMREEGVIFETGVEAGRDVSARYLQRTFDAVIIAAGAREPRDLKIPGRDLDGVHFAMDYLTQQNRRNAGEIIPVDHAISAEGKDVVVIGGGDTGGDCVGTARRQGARSITQIELLPKPPEERPADNPWPTWPLILRSSSSHEEGCERRWSVLTKEFVGVDNRLMGLRCVDLEWSAPDEQGKTSFKEVPGSEFRLNADLALLALGFVHVEHGPLVSDCSAALDARGNLRVDAAHMTSTPGVFAAGDAVLGPSLVVRAIALGRGVAEAVDRYLHRT